MRLSFKDTKVLNPAVILIILIILFVAASIFILFFQNKPKNTSNQSPALQKGKYSTIYHFDNAKPDTSKGTAEAKSEIKGQMVEILSQKNLIDTLYSWGTFKQKFDFGKNGKNEGPITKVVFILTSEKQDSYPYDLGNNLGQSSVNGYIKGDELDIKVYADTNALKHPNDFFTSQALLIPYLWSNKYLNGLTNDQLRLNYTNTISVLTKTQPIFVVYQVGYN
jgi:hypothetical protein